MAVSHFSSAQKPHVYDLIGRLNASFARVFRYMTALEETAVFDPPAMKQFSNLLDELQAKTNSHLLATLHTFEQRDVRVAMDNNK